MSEQTLYRLRVLHGKDLRISYLGHLEMLATIQRSIRRAELPFAVSQGFAKHMRIQFSQALPVGASSECEYYDVFLTQELAADELLVRLKQATPLALAPKECAYVSRSLPALEAWLNRSRWNVRVSSAALTWETLQEACKLLVEKGSIRYMRGDKERSIELAPTFVSLTLEEKGADFLSLMLDTCSSPLGALRPAVFFDALQRYYPELVPHYNTMQVRRICQWHEDSDGIPALAL